MQQVCRSYPAWFRYEEIASGEINHALRFTAENTNSYIWPARHLTSDDPTPNIPPMGARFRLKASFNISGYPAEMQVILRAMKMYGIVLADNGSDWYVSGSPSEQFDNDMLHLLDDITGSDFEAVRSSDLMINYNSGEAVQPTKTISGNTGIAGVTLSYTDTSPKTVTSLTNGDYSMEIPNGWDGTVTPSHACYTFTPASRNYTDVISHQTGQKLYGNFRSHCRMC